MIARGRGLFVAHPYLGLYVVALAAVWIFTLLTWTARAGMHPVAQALQYLVVVFAASLGGYRVRVEAERGDRGEAYFGFRDVVVAMSHDVGGRSFWSGMWVGIAAMEANVLLLVAFDAGVAVATGSHPVADDPVFATYLAWVGAGIAAGALIGMLSAFVALGAATLRGLRRR